MTPFQLCLADVAGTTFIGALIILVVLLRELWVVSAPGLRRRYTGFGGVRWDTVATDCSVAVLFFSLLYLLGIVGNMVLTSPTFHEVTR